MRGRRCTYNELPFGKPPKSAGPAVREWRSSNSSTDNAAMHASESGTGQKVSAAQQLRQKSRGTTDKLSGCPACLPLTTTHICRARCPKSAPQFECRSRRSWQDAAALTLPRCGGPIAAPIAARPMEIQEGREGTRWLCADFVAEVGCRWRSGPGTAVTIPLIAARAGGLDACTDARDASTSTQRSAKHRITQRTTIAGLFPSSCRLSSLGLVAVGGRMTPVCCPTGGGSVQ